MSTPSAIENGSLVLRLRAGSGGRVYWDAQWRFRSSAGDEWRLKKQRLGLAWQESDGQGGWRKRSGRCPEGWLDERSANIEAVAAMERHAVELIAGEQRAREAAERKITVRELAHEWLRWLEDVYGAKPSTLSDYRFLLREPGLPHKRGAGVSHGRIMRAFGDLAAANVTTAEVSRFLRQLDGEKLTPRSVNKHRQILAAIHLRLPRGHLRAAVQPGQPHRQAPREPTGGARLLRGRGGRSPGPSLRAR